MRTEITITEMKCDACGDLIPNADPLAASERRPSALQEICIDVYYGQRQFYRDFCYNCNTKLITALLECAKKK